MHFTGGRQHHPNRKADNCCVGHTNTGNLSTWELILKPHFMGKPLTMILRFALKDLSRLAHKAAEIIQTSEKAKL
jgi:hypothetical protein